MKRTSKCKTLNQPITQMVVANQNTCKADSVGKSGAKTASSKLTRMTITVRIARCALRTMITIAFSSANVLVAETSSASGVPLAESCSTSLISPSCFV